MKYLKKYENYRSLYDLKAGDYVLVKTFYETKKNVIRSGKVISVSKDYVAAFPYKILTSDNDINTYNISNLIRYLTDDEINTFNAQMTANKYNI